MIATSIGIGLMMSLVFAELTGLSAGGLIVPGYLALYFDQPMRIVATLVTALMTFLVVKGISGYVILYGRRRFVAMIITGFLLGYVSAKHMWRIPDIGADMRAVGYVIPGLIANEFLKQGVVRTTLSVIAVSAAVRLVLIVLR